MIPIFGFPGWEYVNLKEVLLYPDSFGEEFEQTGGDRNILGMVGHGAMNRIMILSQHELRQAFLNKTGKTNTAIHEFVHLVDKMDGSTDGMPEFILQRQYMVPWLQLMQKEIQDIIDDKSDINPYGATNEAEFFAVAAEYFFERPELMEEKNPELYQLLVKVFRQVSTNLRGTQSLTAKTLGRQGTRSSSFNRITLLTRALRVPSCPCVFAVKQPL